MIRTILIISSAVVIVLSGLIYWIGSSFNLITDPMWPVPYAAGGAVVLILALLTEPEVFSNIKSGITESWAEKSDKDKKLSIIIPIILILTVIAGIYYAFHPQILEMLKPEITISTPVPVSETFTVDQTYQVDEATALQQFRLACPFSKTATITVVTEGIKIASKNCQTVPYTP